MSTLIIAATAYLALALFLVVVIDNLVAFYFREKRTRTEVFMPVYRMIEVSRRYYRR